jgi:hypothetical protein
VTTAVVLGRYGSADIELILARFADKRAIIASGGGTLAF